MIWKEHSPFRTCINRSHDENNVRLLYPWDATISLRTNKQKYRTCSKECLTSLMKACKEVSTAIYTIYSGKKGKKEDHFIHKFWISDTTNQMKSECKKIELVAGGSQQHIRTISIIIILTVNLPWDLHWVEFTTSLLRSKTLPLLKLLQEQRIALKFYMHSYSM